MRLNPAFTVLAVAALGAAMIVLAGPSVAATSFTWRGTGDGHSWTDPKNWSPIAVPGDGDSVLIESYNDNLCATHVDNVPDGLDLYDFTMDETAYRGNVESPCLSSITGGSLTVEHQLTFHAGIIDTPLTLAPSATGIVTPNVVDDTTEFSAPVTVQGALTLSGDTGSRLTSLDESSAMTIAQGGSLTTQGDNTISSNCCADIAHLINDGTLDVGAGTFDVDAVELDQNAVLNAPSGAQIVTSIAPQTAGAGAQWNGAGSWNMQIGDITATGTQTLSGGFRWILGGHGTTSQETLTGSFSLTGTGAFEWAGGEIDAAATFGHTISTVVDGADGVDHRVLDGLDHTPRRPRRSRSRCTAASPSPTAPDTTASTPANW